MRVFLTGATGFLGRAVAIELEARGHVVSRLVRPAPSRVLARQDIVGDLFDALSYRAALVGFKPDAIVHCGWWGVAGANRNDRRQLDNIVATGALVEAGIAAGARIFVGTGSQAEYGPCGGRIREDHARDPTTLYGVAKVASGQAFLSLVEQAGGRAAWGRVFSLYGRDDEAPWLIPSLIRDFKRGQAPAVTRCEQVWDYLHVSDAARAVVALVECEAARGMFNIGSGEPIALLDVVTTLRDMLAPEIEPLFGAVPYRPDQVMHLEADVQRLRETTGWLPRVTLLEGLRESAGVQGP
ncbi:MAG: GDP-6-deoxy-D-lyxo-4-hexulose reductase [Hyphomicrobiales bacterium]|nr:GDP-6-deoxy-D-lyxo-4-hexulose reductase [Hyphomicrobiales bacterium]